MTISVIYVLHSGKLRKKEFETTDKAFESWYKMIMGSYTNAMIVVDGVIGFFNHTQIKWYEWNKPEFKEDIKKRFNEYLEWYNVS